MPDQTDWEDRAGNILKAEPKRKGVTYAQLGEKLEAIGIIEKEANVRNKLSRGKFSAALMNRIMADPLLVRLLHKAAYLPQGNSRDLVENRTGAVVHYGRGPACASAAGEVSGWVAKRPPEFWSKVQGARRRGGN